MATPARASGVHLLMSRVNLLNQAVQSLGPHLLSIGSPPLCQALPVQGCGGAVVHPTWKLHIRPLTSIAEWQVPCVLAQALELNKLRADVLVALKLTLLHSAAGTTIVLEQHDIEHGKMG